MADPVYNIWIRTLDIDGANPLNNKLKRIALVTVYSKLEFKIVYNNVGGWTLTMPGDIPEADLLKSLLIGTPDEPTNTGYGYGGIVVTRNGTIVFSGPVRGFTETGDYTGPDGKEIEFYGMDDTGYLNSRIPMAPAPAANGVALAGTGVAGEFVAPFFNGWSYWIYGNAATASTSVMENLIRTNIGNVAPFNVAPGVANRRIPFLDVAFTGPNVPFGPTNFVSRSRYAGTLLEKVQEASIYISPAYAGLYPGPYRGAAFRIIQTVNNRLSCNIWDPRNPNYNKGTVFSVGRGNLGGYKYSHQAPEVNYCIAGGQADDNAAARNGTSRWFFHRSSESLGFPSVTRYGLWEGYIDRRDVQYQTPIVNNPPNANYLAMRDEIGNAMDVEMRERGEQVHIEVTTINVPPTVWPDDYNVGDIVTVVIDGYQYQEIVRDVTVTLTKAEGEVVRPTIGTEATGMSIRLFEKFNQLDSSINNLNSSE